MAGNVLGQGYAAGIGMTIGSVFGRIAGREAAAVAVTKNEIKGVQTAKEMA
jgi:tricarballylate dehydrogenase